MAARSGLHVEQLRKLDEGNDLYLNDFSTSVYRSISYTSASQYSHSTEYSTMFKIAFGIEYEQLDSLYLLDFLDGTGNGSSHLETCLKLKSKLDQICQLDSVKVSGSMVYAEKLLRPLFVKQHIEPDVFINNINGLTYFQCEVHSTKQSSLVFTIEDYRCTIRKLCAGLAEQLRGLRQKKPEVLMLCGFYLPSLNFPVEKVECTWNEEYLCFVFVCKPYYDNSTLLTDLRQILRVQQGHFHFQPSVPPSLYKPFVIPLTSDYLRGNFSSERQVRQLRSGESFVVETDNYVYKAPFLEAHRSRLLRLLDSNLQSDSICLPRSRKCVYNMDYFVFPKCQYKPLSLVRIRELFDMSNFRNLFLQTIILALEELHNRLQIAHLDIRIDNICFSAEGRPILIDLDRSLSITSSLGIALCEISKYGKSPMYNLFETNQDTSELFLSRLDYKQLAIMILYIIDNASSIDYYKEPAHNIPNSFLNNLYDGHFNNEQFQIFLCQ